MLGLQSLRITFQRREFHLLATLQLPAALQPGDLVGLEELSDAAGQVANDGVLALVHGIQVQAHVAQLDAMVRQGALRFVILPGRIQQGLGGDTTHIQAGTTQCGLVLLVDTFLDTGRVETQLRTTDGSHITAGATTDDNDVVLVSHDLFLQSLARCTKHAGTPLA